MADWAERFLRYKKWPVTKSNLDFLHSWQRWEGGHTNNKASFNWLNTTTGSRYPAINSVGVRSFPNERTGFAMLSRTLANGRYPNIVRGLRAGNPYKFNVTADLSTWVSGSPTGNTAYAQKVLGGKTTRSTQSVAPAPDLTASPDIGSFALQNLQDLASGQYDPEKSLARMAASMPRPARTLKQSYENAPVGGDPSIVAEAMKWLGTPYSFGGGGVKGPGPGRTGVGFDCSSFLQFLWNKRGVQIPRVTYDQWRSGTSVERNDLKPGDAVFFRMEKQGPGHVGMYIGGGQFIHAPKTGDVVKISNLEDDYYKRNYVGARTYG